MTEATIVPATQEHARQFAPLLRAADVAEVWAAGQVTPLEALERGIGASPGTCWAGFIDGEPVAIFGVTTASLLSGIGVPWMLGTDLIEKHQVTFLRHCRPIVARWREDFAVLINMVDARNTTAHRWLRWLRFELGEPQPHGPEGLPFIPFKWVRP